MLEEQHIETKPSYNITILNFHENKVKNARIDSPRMYTHPKGYRYQITIRPNGLRNTSGFGTHVSVKVISLTGDYDSTLKFPTRFTITLELLNQHRDQDHYAKDIHCVVKDMGGFAKKVHAAPFESAHQFTLVCTVLDSKTVPGCHYNLCSNHSFLLTD